MNLSSCRKTQSIRESRISTKQVRDRNSSKMTLSNCQKIYPQFFNEQKVAMVQKGITTIDHLNAKYKKIDTLYLSNNNITELDNLEQFPCLMHLTLSNNNLHDLKGVIKVLQKLPYLQTLTLHGNPICKTLFYRAQVITKLTNLMVLDGKNVLENEAKAGKFILLKVENVMKILQQNYLELLKADNISKKMSIKVDLLKLVKIEQTIPTIDKLKNITPLPYLGDQDMNQITANLQEDILTLYSQLKLQNTTISEELLYDQASSMLIIKQQGILAEIYQIIDEKIQILTKMNPKEKIQEQQPQLMVQKQGRGRTTAQSVKQKKLMFTENEEPQNFSKNQKKSKTSIERQTPRSSNNRHLFNSCSTDKKQRSFYESSPTKDDPQPQKLNFIPQKQEDVKTKTILKQDSSNTYIKELFGQVDAQSLYIDELEKMNNSQQIQLTDIGQKIKLSDQNFINIQQENEFNRQQLNLKEEQLKNLNNLLDETEKETRILKDQKSLEHDYTSLKETNKLLREELDIQNSQKDDQIKGLYDSQQILMTQIKKESMISDNKLKENNQMSEMWIQETEKKLEASIQMASEFRQKLEQNEQIIYELMQTRDQQELIIRNQKDKIDECFLIIKESQFIYESKLFEQDKKSSLKDKLLAQQDHHLDTNRRTIQNLNQKFRLLGSDESRYIPKYNNDADGQISNSQLTSERDQYTPLSSGSKLTTKYRESSLKQSRLEYQRDNLQNKFVNLQSQLTDILSSNNTDAHTYHVNASLASHLIDSPTDHKKLKRPYSFQPNNYSSEQELNCKLFGKNNDEQMLFASQLLSKTKKNTPQKEPYQDLRLFNIFDIKSRPRNIKMKRLLDEKIKNLTQSIGQELQKSRTVNY